MRPKSGTVSASALAVWDQCPQKWAAQYVDYIPQPQGSTRGNVGTVAHQALELFVQAVFFKKTHKWDDVDYLLDLVYEAFVEIFHKTDMSDEDFIDARKLVRDWHDRTDFTGVEVLSTEQKLRIPTEVDDILFTYIFDRMDKIINEDGEVELRCVDYKSVSQRWTYDEVQNKLQFRLYALCAMIQYKDLQPAGVWVMADLLRFNETVGVFITREECIETWQMLQSTVELILSTDRENAPYRLGVGCRFCPIAASCPALRRNVDAGGVLAVLDPEQALLLHAQLKGQIEGLTGLLDHCEKVITNYAREEDITSLSAKDELGYEHSVEVLAQGRRKLKNPAAVAQMVGPRIAARIGKFNITDLDKLLKGQELDDNRKQQIQDLLTKEYSPKLKFKQKGQ
ncbi:exonuclease [Gordonia phage GordTnk2]|uniref:PD-(D/E)XK endonuclease-like domain-containing protein n=1 Tax=Gordonia phage GordTnk2 TaxID=1622192 RepID=A0A0E3X9Q2_9CAUD|nr:exonuclease [Gordonia phage GordTnk2]AKC02783.1 hypothetical protein GordTnk2_43 [Gordonia phage GordTnk2]